jgi:hypothetical protein
VDLSFPGIRQVATDGAYPSAYERLHWPLWDHLAAKAMRRGNHAAGLRAVLEVIERQYQWFHCAREMIDMWRDMTQEQVSHGAYWFGWSATGWYEAVLCGAAGIWEEPGGLAYVPADQDEAVELRNLPYRGGTWDVQVTGSGSWVSRFAVDGQLQSGVWKVPERCLVPGNHRLQIERAAAPPAHPVVLDSVGLSLLDSSHSGGDLRLTLTGPGRALVRFWAPTAPLVIDAGCQLHCPWDAATGLGWVEISRAVTPGQLLIRASR